MINIKDKLWDEFHGIIWPELVDVAPHQIQIDVINNIWNRIDEEVRNEVYTQIMFGL